MHISKMTESKYLKQADVEEDVLVTVASLDKQNVAQADAEPEWKWCLRFREFDKPMVLNSTNIQLLAKACASEDTDDWLGKQVVLYTDPNVSYGGKLVGGLRIRAARKPVKAAAQSAGKRVDDMDDEVPF